MLIIYQDKHKWAKGWIQQIDAENSSGLLKAMEL